MARPFFLPEARRLLLVCGVTFVTATGWTQNFGEIKGLKLAEPYGPPHETQIKSLLEAAKARRLPDGQYLCADAVLQTFSETGQRELVVRTPQCLTDPVGHVANSAGPLKVQTADGKFTLEGEGFLWQQTNSSLIVSNRVHTVIQPDLLDPAAAKAPTNAPGAEARGIDIFSHDFEYSKLSGVGVYQGNVQVTGTNFALASEKLTVKLPMNERRLQSLVAEQQVAVDYTNTTPIHATANRAVYDPDTGLVHLTEHPAWHADRREGRGEELVIDRTNQIFQANGNAWLKMPAQQKGTFSFLSDSNSIAPASDRSTNQFLEVFSDRYEVRTNSARFWEHVLVKQWAGDELRGTMSCVQMRTTFSGTNELQELVAETNVVIEGEDKRMTGGRAVYTGTNGWLDLTQNPAWKAGTREGTGDLIRAQTQHEEMVVRGHAYLRLPADELGQSVVLQATNSVRKPPAKSSPNQFGEINCEEYTLTPALAVFHGKVHAKHPRMDWDCERLTIRTLPADGKVILGDGGVTFTLIDESGHEIHGKGDHVVYTNNVTKALTNDVIYLLGKPATLEMTNNTTISNPYIILDRANGNLSAPGGEYKITIPAKGPDTNMFRLPKNRTAP